MRKRRIAIVVGSKSDLSQCRDGLKFLKSCPDAEVTGVFIRSQHRNTIETQDLLRGLVEDDVDVAIIGAGWANHLTGCCDAFLRYTLRTAKIPIIGVAFEDEKETRRETDTRHNIAAITSMTEVPGTQVKYRDNTEQVFSGSPGFRRACEAAMGELPDIKLPEPKAIFNFSLDEALELASAEPV